MNHLATAVAGLQVSELLGLRNSMLRDYDETVGSPWSPTEGARVFIGFALNDPSRTAAVRNSHLHIQLRNLEAANIDYVPDLLFEIGTAECPFRTRRYIMRLPSPYTVIEPIPVDIEWLAPDETMACFEDAHMAMSGDNGDDALDSLAAFIMDCLDDWKVAGSETLGPVPTMQLAKLRKHVRWT